MVDGLTRYHDLRGEFQYWLDELDQARSVMLNLGCATDADTRSSMVVSFAIGSCGSSRAISLRIDEAIEVADWVVATTTCISLSAN